MAKPRVIISSDIGGSDPDDMESMAHALTYADQWQIEGLISTPTKHGGRASSIHKAVDAYARDYDNLKTWGNYPTPEYLKSVIHQGNLNVPGPAGYSNPTDGSKAIVQAAKEAKAAGEPLWVLTWGGMTDIAQALHDDPSIAGTVRILSSNGWNGTQDPHSRDYIYNHFKDVWWIESKSTHRGIYINSSGGEGNSFDMNQAKGHGALGDYFYNARPWGVKMGDSWSIAYLTDNADNNNPGANSWGGTFVKNGHGNHFWTDDPNPAFKIGAYKGAAHVREHQNQIYQDMYKHFDRAKAPKPGSSKDADPVVADKGDHDSSPPSSGGSGGSSGSGSNHAVVANNDLYHTDAGQTLWFNSRYLTANDKSADGGLKVVGVDDVSKAGVKVSWAADGTTVYKPIDGWQGVDTIGYKVQDKDGSIDTALVQIKVGDGTSKPPAHQPPAHENPDPTPAHPSTGGSGNAVVAHTDQYSLDAGKTLWFNTRYLTWNDKGADGGLKVIALDKVSDHGVKVSWDDSGTAVYKADPGFQGVDRLNYTVQDKDGSVDTGTLLLKVGHGASKPSGDNDSKPSHDEKSAPAPDHDDAPSHAAGSGDPVVARNDIKYVQPDKTFYFNTRHLKDNDSAPDKGLHVISLDKVSKMGVKVSWGPEDSPKDGTAVYDPPSGWKGVDSLHYTVQDADGSTDTGTVYLNVGHVDFMLS